MTTRNTRDLLLMQVDESLERWQMAKLPKPPANGWIRTIRGALGMTAPALARRLGITQDGVRKLEKAEAEHRITLASLEKIAEALDCEVQYALVPRKPLPDMLMEQARRVAAAQLKPVAHTMALEDQAVEPSTTRKQVESWAKLLLNQRSRRDLW